MKEKRDWADDRASELIRDYGCFPQQGSGDAGEARTRRVIASALRDAVKKHAPQAAKK